MAAPNRIYIQVDFQQANAVQGVNQLNQAISQIGTATQASTQKASQGITSMQQQVQAAQKAAAASATLVQIPESIGKASQTVADLTEQMKILSSTGIRAVGRSLAEMDAAVAALHKSNSDLSGSTERVTQTVIKESAAMANLTSQIKILGADGFAMAGRSAQEMDHQVDELTRSVEQLATAAGKGQRSVTSIAYEMQRAMQARATNLPENYGELLGGRRQAIAQEEALRRAMQARATMLPENYGELLGATKQQAAVAAAALKALEEQTIKTGNAAAAAAKNVEQGVANARNQIATMQTGMMARTRYMQDEVPKALARDDVGGAKALIQQVRDARRQLNDTIEEQQRAVEKLLVAEQRAATEAIAAIKAEAAAKKNTSNEDQAATQAAIAAIRARQQALHDLNEELKEMGRAARTAGKDVGPQISDSSKQVGAYLRETRKQEAKDAKDAADAVKKAAKDKEDAEKKAAAAIKKALDDQAKAAKKAAQDQAKAAQEWKNSFNAVGAALGSLGLANFAGKMIEIAGELDTQRKTLNLWEGSVAAAGVQFQLFMNMSRKAGISLEPALQAFSRLRGAGVASSEATKMIEGFGRALGQMGLGGPALYGVIEQVTQSISKGGRIMREDLKFIQQYVPQISAILQKLYTTSDTEKLAKMPGLSAARVWREVTRELLKLEETAPGIQKMMETFWQQMRLGAEAAGQSIARVVKPQLEAISEDMKQFVKWWNDLPPWAQKAAVYFGEVATGLGLIASGIWGITTAVGALNAAVAANPVTASILIIGAGGYALYKSIPKETPRPGMPGPPEGVMTPTGYGMPGAPFGVPQGYFAPTPPPLGHPLGAGWNIEPENIPMSDTMERILKREKADIELTEKQKAALKRRKDWLADLVRDTRDAVQQQQIEALRAADSMMDGVEKLDRDIRASRMEFTRQYIKDFYRQNEETKAFEPFKPANAQERKQLADANADAIRVQKAKEAEIIAQYARAERDRMFEYFRENATMGFEIYQNFLERQDEAFFEHMRIRRDAEDQMQKERIQQQQRAVEAQRDIRLETLESYVPTTLDEYRAVAEQRLAIENEYVDKALALNLKLLEIEQQKLLVMMDQKAISESRYFDPTYQQAREAVVRSQALEVLGLREEAAEKQQLNRLKNINEQSRIVRDELQKTFEYFRGLAEGVFDALLGKSKSVAQAMADFVKTTVLTMIKAIYTNAIAAMMMRAFGLPVPRQQMNPVLNMLTGGGGGGGGFSPAQLFAGGGGLMGMATGGGTGGYSGGTGGGGFMSYAGTAGSLASLGKSGWLGTLFTGGGKFVPRALGGPIGASVPGGLSYGANATNMAWTGALQTSGIAGSTGLTAALAGMGLFNTGSIAMGGYSTTAAGIGGLGGSLAGFASSPGGIAAGLALLGYGVKRGGATGAAMTIGGGALSGFGIGAMIGSVGGPIGMAVGAGIGGVLGLIGILRKSAEEKLRDRIKDIYGIEISDTKVLRQILDVVKDQYGGDMNVALYTPQIRDMVKLYKMSKGTDEGRPMYPVSYAMSGGQLNLQPVYNGGGTVSSPYTGPTTTQVNAMPVFVQLNPQQANDLFEGKVVQVIDANPEAVANASMAVAGDSSGRRYAAQNAIIEPLTLLH